MINPLLALHILAIGIWLGVIAAELIIELDGAASDEAHMKAASQHYATDIWIEIPAFLIVLVTGLLLLEPEHLQGLFLFKVVAAALAIIFNVVCVVAVFRRRRFAINGDIAGMKTTAPLMKLGGAGFIPAFAVAIVLATLSVISDSVINDTVIS